MLQTVVTSATNKQHNLLLTLKLLQERVTFVRRIAIIKFLKGYLWPFNHLNKKWPIEDNNKALKQAWIDAMQSNKEKDEVIKNLQKEVIFILLNFIVR